MRILDDFITETELRPGYSPADARLVHNIIDCVTCEGFILTSTLKDHRDILGMEHTQFFQAYLRRHETTTPREAERTMTYSELSALAKKCIGSGLTPEQDPDTHASHTTQLIDWIQQQTASRFAEKMDNAITWRILAVTGSGRVALVHNPARPGDDIYLLLGSTVPYVVRRLTSEEARYNLISDAYVPGIMPGELFRQPDTSTVVFDLV